MQKQYTSKWVLLGNSKAALPFINTPRPDNTLFWFHINYINPAFRQKVIFCVTFSCISQFLPGALKPPLKFHSLLIKLSSWKQLFVWTVIEFIEKHKALWYFITFLWVFDLPPRPGVCSSWWALTAAESSRMSLSLTGVGLLLHT